MNGRRVLLVHDYADMQGGAEILMQDLRAALRRRGVDARLIASHARGIVADGDGDGRTMRPDWAFKGSTGPLRSLREVMNPSLMVAVRRALREFRPDVVHLGMIFTQVSPWILPLVAHLPVVWQPHTYRPICPKGTRMLPSGDRCPHSVGRACRSSGCFTAKGLTPRLVQLGLMRRWRGAIDHTVAPSRAFADELEAQGWRVDSVGHHGTSIDVPRQQLDERPLIGFAGRLSTEKGADILVRAFRLLHARRPDARLRIVGDGPERRRLAELVEGGSDGLSAAVEFTGQLGRDQAQQRLNGAWVQVVPSLWPEPFGLVTIEAMARGRVVVASRVGAQPALIADGLTGHLVPAGDVAALAGALEQLLSDRAALERMGDAARASAQAKFDLDTMTSRWLALYEELLDRPRQER